MGGHPQLHAAIEAGADAVYFGLDALNARARAANFTEAELPDVMDRLHERGVQGFVTLNTLVFDEEWALALQLCEAMVRARVDAVIVQDLGLTLEIRRRFPELVIHGSTQMTVTSAEGAAFVASLGVERVVLGRELSVSEIRSITANTNVECEVFVHGALCVSYSGQCFSSEAWGGRSANRGQCAQACRLPYDLLVDGAERPVDGARYMLSPQDLAGIHHVPALIDAGVRCFKIEGRLKGPEYVTATTLAYRRAVDAAWAGAPWTPDSTEWRELEQVFSRGLTPGFLDGVRHQRLVHGRFPKHRGVRLGEVLGVGANEATLRLEAPVRVGVGVVFDEGRPEAGERGGRVAAVIDGGRLKEQGAAGRRVTLRFGERSDLSGVVAGAILWCNDDPDLTARLRAFASGPVRRRAPVIAQAGGVAGEPLTLTLTDGHGRSVSGATDVLLTPARGDGLDTARLRQSLDRFGDSPFVLSECSWAGDGGLFVPPSSLHRLRRALCDALCTMRRDTRPAAAVPRAAEPQVHPFVSEPVPERWSLSVLCRTPAQVDAALAVPWVEEVAVDFLEVRGLGAAVDRVRAAGRRAIAVSPRVLKPDEERLRHFLLRLGADAILVRSLGLLHSLVALSPKERPALHGDFSLNAANLHTVKMLLDAGLTRLTPTHDLNRDQLLALGEASVVARLELITHHHLPIFHTEHCVFARYLSQGQGPWDCGRPCEHHTVHLRSGDGHLHLVQADVGCRNTVFNHEAQSAAASLHSFVQAGWRRFRVELVDHAPEHVAPLLDAYRRVLDGTTRGSDGRNLVRAATPFGVTLGSLRVVQEPGADARKRPGWMGSPPTGR